MDGTMTALRTIIEIYFLSGLLTALYVVVFIEHYSGDSVKTALRFAWKHFMEDGENKRFDRFMKRISRWPNWMYHLLVLSVCLVFWPIVVRKICEK